jgi:small-conductance mechanosensitive channel
LLIVGALILARYVIVWLVRLTTGEKSNERVVFWTRQGASLGTALLIALLLVSVWFDDSQRLGTFAGLLAAGLAFAMQKVVTAFAGYLVILRGNTFTVGDRITMGGVRGDVIALGFLQTRIMEMGEPPRRAEQRPRQLGAGAAVHRPGRDGDQRQGVRHADLQLHAGVSVHLGGDQDPDLLRHRSAPGRADSARVRRRGHRASRISVRT